MLWGYHSHSVAVRLYDVTIPISVSRLHMCSLHSDDSDGVCTTENVHPPLNHLTCTVSALLVVGALTALALSVIDCHRFHLFVVHSVSP